MTTSKLSSLSFEDFTFPCLTESKALVASNEANAVGFVASTPSLRKSLKSPPLEY